MIAKRLIQLVALLLALTLSAFPAGAQVNDAALKLQQDGYRFFSAIVGMMFFSGVLKSHVA